VDSKKEKSGSIQVISVPLARFVFSGFRT